MQLQIIQVLARKNTRVRRQADSEITRLSRSLPRPTKGSSVPIQKEWPVSQSDGERLMVVYMEVEMANKGSKRRSSLLVASLLAA